MSNKKTKLSLLPDEIIINCLAHISKSYYPKLCQVSKRFYSLIFSSELLHARSHLKTREHTLEVCLKLPGHRLPTWFTLCIKPDQILTNDMEEEDNNNNMSTTGNTRLVAKIPSSLSLGEPVLRELGMVGSKYYATKGYNIPPTSSLVWVCNCNEGTHVWREAPSMKVARENLMVGILDGKIYVMGGCSSDETTNWAEVFDPQAQTWESLPDPGAELRSSLIKSIMMAIIGHHNLR